MKDVTKSLSAYVKDKGIRYKSISDNTGLSYDVVYNSMERGRKLRADEFMSICLFLEKNPADFYRDTGQRAS